ncbi:Multimodular transpeptidase-transglycosylase [Salinisphaera sp. PC39]|uniref:penicillin-binding protein 1A n=1 Tax=Salinisphaera sp. PC39 TaxID=1304156 RepID=UPI003341D7EF
MKGLPRAVKILLALFAAMTVAAVLAAAAVGVAYLYFGPQLPEAGEIGETKLNEPMRIYSADGRLLAEFGTERRLPRTFDEIPRQLVQAFLAAEDDRFYEHPGVDYQGLLRAAWHLAITGEKSQGGSTITMQLARNLYLTRERTYTRKIKEIFLALRMEAKLSKQEILELYLNKIYLGNRAYGVGAAAEVYYDKPLAALTLSECATIAGLPKAPSHYNPAENPERARSRRDYVLGRMLAQGMIDEAAHERALGEPVEVAAARTDERYSADYVAEMVRQEMIERFGEAAYTDGYEVVTTIDSERQRAANRALRRALLAYDRRHGWRGAEARLAGADLGDAEAMDRALADRPDAGGLVPAAVLDVGADRVALHTESHGTVTLKPEDIAWLGEESEATKPADLVARGDVVRLAYTGDEASPWVLAQIPAVQGALVAVDPADGAVTSLVGGFDYGLSKFNRVTQARRQPGSAFKPFLYSAGLENGFTPASVINDAPVVFDDPNLDEAWRPENYSGRIHGPTRLRQALVHSRNLVSIRLLRSVGIQTAIDHISSRFGLPADRMPRDLSLSLGSAIFTPMEMARGYAVFANGGFRVEPYFIAEIRDSRGEVLYEAEPVTVCREDCEAMTAPRAPRSADAANIYLMDSMMHDVIRRGTGRRAMSLGRKDLAGKTGTTNEQRDAWFTGYNHALVAVSWVGFDKLEPLGAGETGAQAALPMWVDFMGAALQGVPEKELPRPAGLVTVRIDPETGELAGGGDAIFETFRAENVPEDRARSGNGNDGTDANGDGGGAVEQLF